MSDSYIFRRPVPVSSDRPVRVRLRILSNFSHGVTSAEAHYDDVAAMLGDIGVLRRPNNRNPTVSDSLLLKEAILNMDQTYEAALALGEVFGNEITSRWETSDHRFTTIGFDYLKNDQARRIAYLVERQLNRGE